MKKVSLLKIVSVLLVVFLMSIVLFESLEELIPLELLLDYIIPEYLDNRGVQSTYLLVYVWIGVLVFVLSAMGLGIMLVVLGIVNTKVEGFVRRYLKTLAKVVVRMRARLAKPLALLLDRLLVALVFVAFPLHLVLALSGLLRNSSTQKAAIILASLSLVYAFAPKGKGIVIKRIGYYRPRKHKH